MDFNELLKKIEECERRGDFHQHIDEIDISRALPVDEHYPFIHKPLIETLTDHIKHNAILKPFSIYLNICELKTKVEGREKLAQLPAAIVTCNHVFMYDFLVVKHALRGHRLHITAAEFNHQKGFCMGLVRAARLMPIPLRLNAKKRFCQAIEHHLKNNDYILFYPEAAMWPMYEKPRPYKSGAFHFAAKHSVPILPLFITFRNSGAVDEEGRPIKNFTISILDPLFPDPSKNTKENTEMLKNKNFEACKRKYEDVYQKPLSYLE